MESGRPGLGSGGETSGKLPHLSESRFLQRVSSNETMHTKYLPQCLARGRCVTHDSAHYLSHGVCDRPQSAHGLVGEEKSNQATSNLLESDSFKGETLIPAVGGKESSEEDTLSSVREKIRNLMEA